MQRFAILLFLMLAGFCSSAQTMSSLSWNGTTRLTGITPLFKGKPAAELSFKSDKVDDVTVYYVNVKDDIKANAKDFTGLFFDNPANTTSGVAVWRYKPWNSWSKPIAVKQASQMPDWDVQFFYWKYKDGTYGAAVPLSGKGYRTTLGSEGKKWGSKASALVAGQLKGEIPALAVAFDKNPYALFAKIYRGALKAMGKGENLRTKKTFPEVFNYLGWCTWNSSDLGKNLSEEHVFEGVKTFTDHQFPLGWVLIDDGWFQNKNQQLQSQLPDPKKFPNGFISMNKRLKSELGIKYTGVWHAFNGYWNGIDPDSELGRQYKNDLFSWTQSSMTDTAKKSTYYFIKPESGSLDKFFDTWYSYFKQQGFDFTKVDHQLVAERMALNNYPVFTLSEKMHEAIYKASDKYLDGALINCMDMSAEAYLNFGSSAVARTVEDYFPYKKNETYNLQEGNAAAHVLQAIYNSLYFSQMVYPDFDMFQTNNPNAVFHAIARALNCGPIYITDKPGEQNFEILNALVYHDGRTVRSETPLLPTADCLFQVQDKKLFKAYSKVGNTGLLAVFNAADADKVYGKYCAADIDNLSGSKFAVYEHFSKQLKTATKTQLFDLSLKRMGYKLYYIVPVKNGFAPFGLTKKYNAPATIIKQSDTAKQAKVTLYEGGEFKAYSVKKPVSVTINGKRTVAYLFKNNTISLTVPQDGDKHPEVIFNW